MNVAAFKPVATYADDEALADVLQLFRQAGFSIGEFARSDNERKPFHIGVFSGTEMSSAYAVNVRRIKDETIIEVKESINDDAGSLELWAEFRGVGRDMAHYTGKVGEWRLHQSEPGYPAELGQFIGDIALNPAGFIRTQMRQGFLYPK